MKQVRTIAGWVSALALALMFASVASVYAQSVPSDVGASSTGLPPALRKRINSRKKDYIHFLENLMEEVQRARHAKGKVGPHAAAFALLGMINWIYQWHKPEGELQAQNLIPQFTDLIFGGIFT